MGIRLWWRDPARATKLRMRTWTLAWCVAALIACTSPTLPLPPPSLPTVSVGSEPNTFRLKSERGALPNALIIAVNRNTTIPSDQRVEGTLADEQGSWELEMKANAGDFVDISQEDGTSRSSLVTVQLK